MKKLKLMISVALMLLFGVAAARAEHSTMLEFNTMTPVTGPFVGTANPIRGVSGGGLPWTISKGQGELRSGDLEVHVRGLVLAAGPLAGTNPIPNFRALVSCQSIDSNGQASVVNISTDNFPATSAGDSEIQATVEIPIPCLAPRELVRNYGPLAKHTLIEPEIPIQV